MTTPEPDLTGQALASYARRVTTFCDMIALATDPDTEPVDSIHEVIARECAFLVTEGPQAYLRYVAALDAAAIRADLRLIQGGEHR